MDKASSHRLLWILLLVGLLGCAGSLPRRIALERASRTVEVTADYDSYSEYFHAQGQDDDEGFAHLKTLGVTALAFNESYLSSLQQAGRLKLYSGPDMAHARRLEDLPNAGEVNSKRVYLVIYDDETFKDIQTSLGIWVGSSKVAEWGRPAGSVQASHNTPRVLEVVGSERFMSSLGMGFSTPLVEHFRDMGFHIVLRPENKSNLTPKKIDDFFASMPKADCIVFGGVRNEALGYPTEQNLDEVKQQLQDRAWQLGEVEVPTPKAALKGQEYLLLRLVTQAVRVQSIAPGQQSKLQPSDALDMFQLGVRERNVRMLFLRPFADPDDKKRDTIDPLTGTNDDYVQSVSDMLKENGFNAGLSSTFEDVKVPLWSALLLNVSVGASVALLWLAFRPDTPLPLLLAGPLLFALGRLGMGLVHPGDLWDKLAALVGALTLPTLATFWMLDRVHETLDLPERPRGQALGVALGWLVQASLISMAGGLIVASILAHAPFMLEIDQFRGIKLLMIIPPLLALLYAATRQGASLRQLLIDLWDTPMTMGLTISLLVVMAGAVFYIMRTGNTPETGASDMERAVRVILQKIFVARPRFKDFCIGHPAFILTSALVLMRGAMGSLAKQPVLLLGMVLASIGQADLVDTCAHIHTPFLISLLRIFNGLWLGVVIGSLATLLIRAPQATPRPPSP